MHKIIKNMMKFIYKLPLFFLNISTRMLRKQLVKLGHGKVTQNHFLKRFEKEYPKKFLEYFKTPNTLKFFIDGTKKEEVTKKIREIYPKSIDQTIKDADKICEHVFDLLGSGETDLKKLALMYGLKAKENGYVPINWQQDFKSGKIWHLKYIEEIERINLKDESDIKVPWELSRFQHIPTLGKAYWYTGDEKYTKEFMNQTEDWFDNNPVYFGVNWYWAMDASTRAVNWIWGCFFFKDSPLITNKFAIILFRSLLEHGKFIFRNLEFGQIRGNHYISDIVGLIYLGFLFQETKEGGKWLKKGLSALEEEMKFQVYPDGVHFEGSISYHRLVAELFLSSVILCKINNVEIPERIIVKLEKMVDFTMYYTKPNGAAPIIGDADDGRLYKLAGNEVNDHRYLLNIGAVLFNRSDFKAAYPEFNEESYWLLGGEGYKKFNEVPLKEKCVSSKAFPDNGFYIMRKDDLYMFICGGHQKKPLHTGHMHNDTLSFELYAGDKAFIIDPGTYVYTSHPDWRNKFRSTAYHNTVVVDGIEQNEFSKGDVFRLKSFDALAKVNKWESNEEYDLFDSEHYGYHKLENPITHRRKIYFDKKEKYWEITDVLAGKGKHLFEWYFHFAAMKLEQDEKNPLIVRTKCNGANIELVPRDAPFGMECKILEGWVSYSYGRKVRAPVVGYKVNKEANFENKVVINLIEEELE